MSYIQCPPQYANPISFTQNSQLNDEKHTWSSGYLQSFSNLFDSLGGEWNKQSSGVIINGVEANLNLNISPYFVGVSGILKNSGQIVILNQNCEGILTITNGTSTFSVIISGGVGVIPIGTDNFMISGLLNNLSGV